MTTRTRFLGLSLVFAFLAAIAIWTAGDSLGASEPKRDEPAKKESIKGKSHAGPNTMLIAAMMQLHSEAYMHFITQEGFGKSRLIPTVTVVKREWKLPEWTSEELAKQPPPLRGMKDLELIHRFGLERFSDSNSGKLRDTLPNIKAPKKEFLWEIKSLDLVGLVMHDEPVVYMSDKVPDMKDLKKHPTRDLDPFEAEGLEELRGGKTHYIRSKNNTIRMLGPLLAGKSCMKCHSEAKEGDMLGAFSYTLRAGEYEVTPRLRPPVGVNPVAPKKG